MAAVYSKCIRCQEESRVRRKINSRKVSNPQHVSHECFHDLIFLSAIFVSVFVVADSASRCRVGDPFGRVRGGGWEPQGTAVAVELLPGGRWKSVDATGF